MSLIKTIQYSFWCICLSPVSMAGIQDIQMAARSPIQVNIATPGDISTSSAVSLPFIGPGLDTALAQLRLTYTGIFNFTQSYIYDKRIKSFNELPAHCDEMISKWYYEGHMDTDFTVFLFSGSIEVGSINRLAAGWNSLMITSAATSPMQTNKRISPTWLTTGCCSAMNFANPYLYLMTEYNWSSIYVVVDAATPMTPVIAEAVSRAMQRRARTQQTTFTIPVGGRSREIYETILREFNSSSRVLFFFGHSDALRNLMIQAAKLDMITGSYVYITVEPYRNTFMFGNLSWEFHDGFDDIAKAGYRSVLVVAIADYINMPGLRARSKLDLWKRLSSLDYNYTYRPHEQMSPHVAVTYYTMLMFAETLNDTLTTYPDFDFRDGVQLARRFLNRTTIIDGVPIYVDTVGERRTDVVIKQFNEENGEFEDFLAQSGATEKATHTAALKWFGGNQLPSNEPPCGFTGRSLACTLEETSAKMRNAVIGILVVVCGVVAVAAIVFCRIHAREHLSAAYWWLLSLPDLEIQDSGTGPLSTWISAQRVSDVTGTRKHHLATLSLSQITRSRSIFTAKL